MRYNRKRIEELDPRQCVYVNYHDECGWTNLIVGGETHLERTAKTPPMDEEIKKALKGYEDREAFLWNNMRGWALVFKTEINEKSFKWDRLRKVN